MCCGKCVLAVVMSRCVTTRTPTPNLSNHQHCYTHNHHSSDCFHLCLIIYHFFSTLNKQLCFSSLFCSHAYRYFDYRFLCISLFYVVYVTHSLSWHFALRSVSNNLTIVSISMTILLLINLLHFLVTDNVCVGRIIGLLFMLLPIDIWSVLL